MATDAARQVPDGTAQHGVNTTKLPAGCSEIDAFSLIFDRTFYTTVKSETNRYARSNMSDTQAESWKTEILSCMFRFFAIILHMCIVKKPTIADYFSTDPVLHSSFASSTGMGRNRFQQILRYLHLNDNANHVPRDQDSHDPLFKTRPIFDSLLAKF